MLHHAKIASPTLTIICGALDGQRNNPLRPTPPLITKTRDVLLRQPIVPTRGLPVQPIHPNRRRPLANQHRAEMHIRAATVPARQLTNLKHLHLQALQIKGHRMVLQNRTVFLLSGQLRAV